MKVNTDRYEFAHGRKPRGYGLWYFAITFTDAHNHYSTETVSAYGTMRDALAVAWKSIRSTIAGARSMKEAEVLT